MSSQFSVTIDGVKKEFASFEEFQNFVNDLYENHNAYPVSISYGELDTDVNETIILSKFYKE